MYQVADIKRMNGLVSDLQMFALKTLQIPLPGRHPPSPSLSNGLDTQGYSNFHVLDVYILIYGISIVLTFIYAQHTFFGNPQLWVASGVYLIFAENHFWFWFFELSTWWLHSYYGCILSFCILVAVWVFLLLAETDKQCIGSHVAEDETVRPVYVMPDFYMYEFLWLVVEFNWVCFRSDTSTVPKARYH